MFVGCRSLFVSCAASIALAALPSASLAQPIDSTEVSTLTAQIPDQALPDAHAPQITVADNEIPNAPDPQQPAQPTSGQQTDSSQISASQSSTGQSSSSAQAEPAQTGDSEGKKHEEAEEQMKQEEKQRVLGIVPNFNITYLGQATVSLSAKEKINLAFHTVTDPVAFVIPFFVAGYHEALDEDKGFPWGIKGLGERSGAAYLDATVGNMLGNGFLPAILHQDPRYYRLGYGSATHRVLYSLATNVVARHDNTGKWEPNYSNLGGNIIGGAISNLYYPNSDSGIGLTISNGLIVTAEGAFGSLFDEFWPDIARKVLHKDPTHGLDAQARQQDQARKQAKIQAKQQSTTSN